MVLPPVLAPSLLAVDAEQSFVVDHEPLLTQKDGQASIAEPPPFTTQHQEPFA
jgi:hypothetical protein